MESMIGIVGGLGPQGTVHYYRKCVDLLASLPVKVPRPGIVIEHLWLHALAPLMQRGAAEEVTAMLSASLGRLQRAGATLGLISAVTPHRFLATVRPASPLPLVDIVEATRRELTAARVRTVALLGTRITLTEPFFRTALAEAGIRVVLPGEDDIAFLDGLIFGELGSGRSTPAMRTAVTGLVRKLTGEGEVEAVVVACTDLMDLIDSATPLIDPIDCHLRRAVEVATGVELARL